MMRTLLVISSQTSFTSAISAVLDNARFQIIVKENVREAEFLLSRGAIDATVIDVEQLGAQALRSIEDVKMCAPGCPIVVYGGEIHWQWEEDAYLLGVAHVLDKPVRGKLLNTLLVRLFPENETHKQPPPQAPTPATEPVGVRYNEGLRSLEALRRFSGVLAHSLDANALLKQFLLLLREVIGVNRAIIFLRKPASRPSEGPVSMDDRWLRSACAIGLDPAVLQHFGLSLNAGIGGYLHRHGRVLRASSTEAAASREISKEFQLLGVQIAIPILDRESLLGVAVFDERLTGAPFVNEEVALIFHLLEEIGLALRNSWLHNQIVANHAMIGDILGQLGGGAVVFGSDLATLHANAAARKIFNPSDKKAEIQFSDLPQVLGSLVYSVVKNGASVAPFKHVFDTAPDQIFSVEIVPFRADVGPNAALLLIEDITQVERAQRLETEASNLRLVRSMAEHLAHEIGNALVPISTHQQLLKDSINDREFQESLGSALAGGVKRITRLANQMVFLARDWHGDFGDAVSIGDLIVEAFQDAHTHHPGKKVAQLSFNQKAASWKVKADPKALRHAFSEIMLNALQANPENPIVAVNLEERKGTRHVLTVEVHDRGKGFTAETAERAPEPFFSTRNVGLGIGLTVSRRIIESHRGRIEITPSPEGQHGIVRISLPLDEVVSQS